MNITELLDKYLMEIVVGLIVLSYLSVLTVLLAG